MRWSKAGVAVCLLGLGREVHSSSSRKVDTAQASRRPMIERPIDHVGSRRSGVLQALRSYRRARHLGTHRSVMP